MEPLKEEDVVRMLRDLPDLPPPRGGWDRIEGVLREEQVIRPPWSAMVPVRALGARRIPLWGAMAAGLALFLAGLGAGGGGGVGTDAGFASALVEAARSAPSLDAAAELVRVAEEPYHAALARYQELASEGTGPTTPGFGPAMGAPDPLARLAALEAILAAGEVALRQAPADPFLSGVLSSASVQREMALRRFRSQPEETGTWF